MRALRFLVPALASLCAGCVALSSEPIGEGADGVTYHLPKTLLTITAFEFYDEETGNKWYQIGGLKKTGNNEYETEQTAAIPDEIIPDLEHRYVIQYNPSITSDDRLCISRTPTGLLYDVQFASDDRTPQIAFNIARFLAGSIEKQAGASRVRREDTTKVRRSAYTAKIDPFNPDDIRAFDEAMRRAFRADVRLDFKRARDMVEKYANCGPKGCSHAEARKRCGRDSNCYRTKVALPIELRLNGRVVDVNYAEVINRYEIGAVSVTRAFMTNKISKFRFEKGALVGAIIRKPSELEEITLLPLNVINAVLITPTGLWAKAFTGAGNNQALVTEMKSMADAVKDLNDKVGAVAQNVGPVAADEIKYTLNCQSPTRQGSFFNLFTNSNGNEGD